jgi:methionine-rich copper-binding protein CopC
MRARHLILAAGVLLALGAKTVDTLHFALSRSVPAADATVTAPAEVRLFFTEAPQANSVSVRVLDAAGAALETPAAAPNADDAKIYSLAIGRTLPAGRYSVAWRGAGADGHGVQGTFAFTVSAE